MDFSQKFYMQGMFLPFSFDSLLPRGSRDVFTDFLARSVQELWLIKCLPTTAVAGAGIKGLSIFHKVICSRNVLVAII